MERLSQFLNHRDFFKYSVAALLLVVPLYPKFPLLNIPGTHVAIRAEDFLIALLAVALLRYAITRGFSFSQDRIGRAILIFLTVGFLSLLSAIFITHSVQPHLGLLHWLRRVEYIVPFFVALVAIKRGTSAKFLIEVLLVVSFVAFLYGWGQIHANFPVISTQNEEYAKGLALRWIPGSRLHSTFAGHYDLAAFLVLVFPIAIAYLFALRDYLRRLFFFVGVLAPSFWIFLQTESRVSFISYMIGITFTLFMIRKKKFIVPALILSILGMFLLSDLGGRYWRTINVYRERIMSENVLAIPGEALAAEDEILVDRRDNVLSAIIEDRSTSIRFNVEWPRAFRSFSRGPLLGTGYSSITLATDSDYLRLLGEVGLIGTLAFLLVIVRMVEGFGRFMRKARSIDPDTAFVGGFLGSLVGLLVTATFIDVFEASKVAIVFWTLAGIAVGLVRRRLGATSLNFRVRKIKL